MTKRDRTLATHAGNHPKAHHGIVNPPVYHASTVLYDSVADMRARHKERFNTVYYGRYGTPTTFALEEAVAALEEADRAVAVPSGLGAVSGALLSFLGAGDHVLMVDSTYEPTRVFCDTQLRRFGIETTYYDPSVGAGIAALIRPNTKVVYLESPGSHTFEIQDVPAIAAAAHERDCVVILDNTWASPLFFKPYRHGVDVVVHAATKYIVGHSDVMMGIITMRDRFFTQVKTQVHGMGFAVGGDDCYLALRGLRTIGARLAQHQQTALTLANWLKGRPEVARVLHPALPEHPGHDLWKRDFLGSSGLFGVVFNPFDDARVAAMIDGMELFGLGFSWGGYESLMVPSSLGSARTATRWRQPGPTVRIHAGLEDPDDLIADLARGLDRLRGN
ncbi:cystathionine beta-lyase [Dongia mobilis]|uniref:Cystathionine beta-lyase n=1 Tax=Dongia mobilis TaxID=578943 RepID=A0A4V6PXE9_9PROT|nr:cystathionine beta-lyase [Dongia mobilis]TDQ77602.1 cystathionine beta-lyase [Dongia mobilis]